MMFEYLKEYPVILVTGPQRSGTRICAKMIAHDTGHRFVDEREIYTDSLYELMQVIKYQRKEPVVVQCPALMYVVHRVAACIGNELAVVVLSRSTQDIVESQRRVGWRWGFLESWHYPDLDGPICDIKYLMWIESQEPWIAHAFEVEYESLSEHPLWIPKEQRKDFDAWQTE